MIPTAHSPLATHQGTNPHAAQRTPLAALGKSPVKTAAASSVA